MRDARFASLALISLGLSTIALKDEVYLAGRGINRYPHNYERVSPDTSINRDELACFRSRYSIFVGTLSYPLRRTHCGANDAYLGEQGEFLTRTTESFLPFPFFPLFDPHFSLFPQTSTLATFESSSTTIRIRQRQRGLHARGNDQTE